MMKPLRVVKSTARRITGFSVPIFGLQWEPLPDERRMVRAFLAFLEDRRALYVPTQVEIEGDVRWSVESIRGKCSELLGQLGEASPAAASVRAIRQACRRYMTKEQSNYPNLMPHGPEISHQAGWLVALGELRSTVGFHIGALSTAYGIEVEDELAGIVPWDEVDDE